MRKEVKSLDHEVTLQFTSHVGCKGMHLIVSGEYYHRGIDGDVQSGSSRINDHSKYNLYKVTLEIQSPVSRLLFLKYEASIQVVASDYQPNQELSVGSELIPTKNRGYSPIVYVEAMRRWKRMQYMMMLNYKRALQGIPYSAISLTVRWSDSHNYTVGNPNLQAAVFDMVMAGVLLWRNLLNLSAVYSHCKNEIFWTTSMSDSHSDVYFTKPINLSSSNRYGVMAELNVKPVKPWLLKLSARYEFCSVDMILNGISYGKMRLCQYHMLNNNFNFTHMTGMVWSTFISSLLFVTMIARTIPFTV